MKLFSDDYIKILPVVDKLEKITQEKCIQCGDEQNDLGNAPKSWSINFKILNLNPCERAKHNYSECEQQTLS